MAKKETAEQKLLKIIETSQGHGEAASKPAAASSSPASGPASGGDLAREMASAVKNPGLAIPGLENILGRFKGKSGPAFGPREINRFLLIGVTFALFAFAVNIFSGAKLLKKEITFSVDAKTVPSEMTFFPTVAAAADYLASIKKRNIFAPYEKKEEAPDALSGPSRLSSLVQKFRLVGISWLDSPTSASAMIEDTEAGTTRFLKVGDTINNVTIKQIYADRVVLTYEGEELTLKL